MQRLCWTNFRAFIAENTLWSVFPLAGFLINLHVHGADSETLPTMDALILIAVDAQQRKIAHGLEKHRDGAKTLAKRAVILAHKKPLPVEYRQRRFHFLLFLLCSFFRDLFLCHKIY